MYREILIHHDRKRTRITASERLRELLCEACEVMSTVVSIRVPRCISRYQRANSDEPIQRSTANDGYVSVVVERTEVARCNVCDLIYHRNHSLARCTLRVQKTDSRSKRGGATAV